jgi:hypothetical protein
MNTAKSIAVASGLIACGTFMFAGPYDRNNGLVLTGIEDPNCPAQEPNCGWTACQWAEVYTIDCDPEGAGCNGDGEMKVWHSGTCNYSGTPMNSSCACW